MSLARCLFLDRATSHRRLPAFPACFDETTELRETRPEHCGCNCCVSAPLPSSPPSQSGLLQVSLTGGLVRSQPRPVPSPAFNQDSRRNEVHPLQNVHQPEMDDS
jgi:hypothetical protein